MKTTIDLPDELMRNVKIRAAMEGRKLKDVFSDVVRAGLYNIDSRAKPDEPLRIESDRIYGLPVIAPTVAAPGSVFTADQVLQLERDAERVEDLKRAGLSL